MNEIKVTGRVLAISEATRRRNPQLFAVGAVVPDSAKRPAVQALVKSVQKPTGSTAGVQVIITVIAFRRRLLDRHDAVAYAAKPLTDAIAERLGVDDANERLTWKYEQFKTDGEQGTVVKIEVFQLPTQ